MGTPFDYAPAPESRAVVDLKASYGLFIDGDFSEAADGGAFKTISPSSEEVLAEVAEAGAADVDRAVKAARTAYTRTWSKMSGRERGKYLFRIARLIQERSRELAVLETLDDGKPIKESRDVDVPAGRGALLLPRGLGRQARLRRARPRPAAARRGRPDHPVELPAAHAGVEDRPRPRGRQHRGAQARRDHPADGPAVRRDLPAGRPAARASSTSSPAPARPAARSSSTPASTRSRSPARPRSAS